MTHPTTDLRLKDELSQRALRYVLDKRVYAAGFRDFVVANPGRRSGYHVHYVTGDGTPNCRCKTSREHKQTCVHIRAVELAIKLDQLQDLATSTEAPRSEAFKADAGTECGHCGSCNYRKDGTRPTKHGRNQMYECKACGKRFSNDLGFARHRYSAAIIDEALDLRMEGFSMEKVRRHPLKRRGVKPSITTQYRWQRKFGRLLAAYDEQNAPAIRDAWQADESAMFVRGRQHWSIHVYDPRSRYWIANLLSKTRQTKDATKALLRAKEVAKGAPRFVVTDGHTSYPRAIKKHLWRQKAPTTHVACPPIRSIKAKHGESKDKGVHLTQNRIERLNGTAKARTDLVRGFKDRVAGEAFVRTLKAHYNLIRPHQSLGGQTPAEAMGMRMPQLDGGTRLLAILIEQFKRERSERRKRQGLSASDKQSQSEGGRPAS